jgi:hypothetical protein
MSPDELLLRRLAREIEWLERSKPSWQTSNDWAIISDSDMFFATSTVLCFKCG